MGADGPVGTDGLIELSDAIGMVREQLVQAQLAGRRVVAGRVLTATPTCPTWRGR
jgi:hypothetical protein